MRTLRSRLCQASSGLCQRRKSSVQAASKGTSNPTSPSTNLISCLSSRSGHPGLKANLKAVQGDLFMLEKYIFFVSKQPVLIEISDIHQVVFSRLGAGIATARTFDMQIITKHGPEYTFTSINKEEHEPTDAYLKDKKVRVKNEMVPDGDLLLAAAGDDSDEEMQSVASDDDEEPRVRRTGDDDDDTEDGALPPTLPPYCACSLTHSRRRLRGVFY